MVERKEMIEMMERLEEKGIRNNQRSNEAMKALATYVRLGDKCSKAKAKKAWEDVFNNIEALFRSQEEWKSFLELLVEVGIDLNDVANKEVIAGGVI